VWHSRHWLNDALDLQEWDKIGPRETSAKVQYVKSKLDKRLAALAAQQQQQQIMMQAQVPTQMQPGAHKQQQQQAAAVAAQVRAAMASVSSLASLDGGMGTGVGPVRVAGPVPGVSRSGRAPGEGDLYTERGGPPVSMGGGVRVSPPGPGPGGRQVGVRRSSAPPPEQQQQPAVVGPQPEQDE
jgi:hypothetical protein